jgi:hypothetical protein
MTSDEIRGGLVRMLGITIGLLVGALVLSALFLLLGARWRPAVAAGTGALGIVLIFAGVAAFAKASPVRHLRSLSHDDEVYSEDRRDTERLALGLFAYGVAFEAAALALG